MAMASSADDEWQPVCRVVELEVSHGVTALVHGQAIAIFRADDDSVYALGNHDPFARGATGGIAKGIVGRRDGVPFVASPTHKHAFDLRSGRCLDDANVVVPAYDVKIVDGMVTIGRRRLARLRSSGGPVRGRVQDGVDERRELVADEGGTLER